MKKLIFIDVDGSRYYQTENGDIVDHRGDRLGIEHENNIRLLLCMERAGLEIAFDN